jgi:hypothetical protein
VHSKLGRAPEALHCGLKAVIAVLFCTFLKPCSVVCKYYKYWDRNWTEIAISQVSLFCQDFEEDAFSGGLTCPWLRVREYRKDSYQEEAAEMGDGCSRHSTRCTLGEHLAQFNPSFSLNRSPLSHGAILWRAGASMSYRCRIS